MSLADRRRLATRRLAALGLTRPLADPTPLGVTRALGALQAQDLASGLWSIGVRTGGTLEDVLAAIDRREIVRTWPMRGTLHWVPAADAAWMCRLLAGPAIRAAAPIHAATGLDAGTVARSGDLWAAHLSGGGGMSRAQAAEVLTRHGIDASGQRTYHLLVRHAQEGLLCQGPIRRTATGTLEPTFVLLAEWVPQPHRPADESALSELLERYLRSHGPVTERDLAGWCGQPLRPVRAAVAALGDRVRQHEMGDTAYLVHEAAPQPAPREPVLLLPGFDEWLLGYKDRRAQLTAEQERVVVPGGNGMFRGTVVAGGLVVATWRRGSSTRELVVRVDPFAVLSARTRAGLERAVAAYGRFWGRRARVEYACG